MADFVPGAATWRSWWHDMHHLCFWPVLWKHDVIHKTSTQRIALPSKDDQATATGNMYRKLSEIWTCGVLDMRSDWQTQSEIDTDTLITILCTPISKTETLHRQKNRHTVELVPLFHRPPLHTSPRCYSLQFTNVCHSQYYFKANNCHIAKMSSDTFLWNTLTKKQSVSQVGRNCTGPPPGKYAIQWVLQTTTTDAREHH